MNQQAKPAASAPKPPPQTGNELARQEGGAIAVRREQYHQHVDRMTTNVVAAMSLTVPDEALKRARTRFRVAFSADAQEKLAECAPDSIARAIILSALSGLYPGGPNPDVYLIPRKNKHRGNILEANWQMSFRGYMRLARRAGFEVEPVLVFAADHFVYEEGTIPRIEHRPNLDEPQTWETLRGGYVRVYPVGHREQAKFAWLSKARILERRRKAQDDGIWRDWPLEMAQKTLCHFAGQREMFPCDDPARYAIQSDTNAEIGAGGQSPVYLPTTPAPVGSSNQTAALSGRIVEASASLVDGNGAGSNGSAPYGDDPTGEEGDDDGQGGESAGADPQARPRLNLGQLGQLREVLREKPVVPEAIVAQALDPTPGDQEGIRGPKGALSLGAVEGDPGETGAAFYTRVLGTIRDLKKD